MVIKGNKECSWYLDKISPNPSDAYSHCHTATDQGHDSRKQRLIEGGKTTAFYTFQVGDANGMSKCKCLSELKIPISEPPPP